jgi:hypothetical protein
VDLPPDSAKQEQGEEVEAVEHHRNRCRKEAELEHPSRVWSKPAVQGISHDPCHACDWNNPESGMDEAQSKRIKPKGERVGEWNRKTTRMLTRKKKP